MTFRDHAKYPAQCLVDRNHVKTKNRDVLKIDFYQKGRGSASYLVFLNKLPFLNKLSFLMEDNHCFPVSLCAPYWVSSSANLGPQREEGLDWWATSDWWGARPFTPTCPSVPNYRLKWVQRCFPYRAVGRIQWERFHSHQRGKCETISLPCFSTTILICRMRSVLPWVGWWKFLYPLQLLWFTM